MGGAANGTPLKLTTPSAVTPRNDPASVVTIVESGDGAAQAWKFVTRSAPSAAAMAAATTRIVLCICRIDFTVARCGEHRSDVPPRAMRNDTRSAGSVVSRDVA